MKIQKDRVVLITGGSSGIGRATVEAFLEDGARVATFSRTPVKGLQVHSIQGDLRRPTDIERAVEETVRHFGDLHVLINNAGEGLYARVEDTSDEDLGRLFDTNVFGAVRAIRAALPHLRKTHGQIINISSVFSRSSVPFCAAYCMTKAAIHSLSISLRIELRGSGVQVIEVAPGPTDTPFKSRARMIGFDRLPDFGSRFRPAPAHRIGREILLASRRRKREVLLSFQGSAFIWAQNWFPSTTDWILGAKFGEPGRRNP